MRSLCDLVLAACLVSYSATTSANANFFDYSRINYSSPQVSIRQILKPGGACNILEIINKTNSRLLIEFDADYRYVYHAPITLANGFIIDLAGGQSETREAARCERGGFFVIGRVFATDLDKIARDENETKRKRIAQEQAVKDAQREVQAEKDRTKQLEAAYWKKMENEKLARDRDNLKRNYSDCLIIDVKEIPDCIRLREQRARDKKLQDANIAAEAQSITRHKEAIAASITRSREDEIVRGLTAEKEKAFRLEIEQRNREILEAKNQEQLRLRNQAQMNLDASIRKLNEQVDQTKRNSVKLSNDNSELVNLINGMK